MHLNVSRVNFEGFELNNSLLVNQVLRDNAFIEVFLRLESENPAQSSTNMSVAGSLDELKKRLPETPSFQYLQPLYNPSVMKKVKRPLQRPSGYKIPGSSVVVDKSGTSDIYVEADAEQGIDNSSHTNLYEVQSEIESKPDKRVMVPLKRGKPGKRSDDGKGNDNRNGEKDTEKRDDRKEKKDRSDNGFVRKYERSAIEKKKNEDEGKMDEEPLIKKEVEKLKRSRRKKGEKVDEKVQRKRDRSKPDKSKQSGDKKAEEKKQNNTKRGRKKADNKSKEKEKTSGEEEDESESISSHSQVKKKRKNDESSSDHESKKSRNLSNSSSSPSPDKKNNKKGKNTSKNAEKNRRKEGGNNRKKTSDKNEDDYEMATDFIHDIMKNHDERHEIDDDNSKSICENDDSIDNREEKRDVKLSVESNNNRLEDGDEVIDILEDYVEESIVIPEDNILIASFTIEQEIIGHYIIHYREDRHIVENETANQLLEENYYINNIRRSQSSESVLMYTNEEPLPAQQNGTSLARPIDSFQIESNNPSHIKRKRTILKPYITKKRLNLMVENVKKPTEKQENKENHVESKKVAPIPQFNPYDPNDPFNPNNDDIIGSRSRMRARRHRKRQQNLNSPSLKLRPPSPPKKQVDGVNILVFGV